MKEHTTFLSRRILYWVILVTLALIAVGSFVDFPLSFALYDASNPFATFFAAYGAIPAPLGCVAAGTLFVCGHNRDNKVLGTVQNIGGILLLFVGILLVCFLPALYMPASPLLLAGVGLVLSAGTILITCRLAKGADRAMIIRVALAIVLVLLCELVVVNLIKVAWGRPRMRLVVSHPEAFFVPWWQLGNALKEPLMAAGVAADEFKSFPSGHTANATTMLLLGLVPYLKPQLQKYQKALVAFGFAWAAIVALSRILLGAHYLTDTTVGFLVGFLSVYLICGAVLRPRSGKL
ncbi:phosphatase PAP2 family protein [uncultured Subdoligranulum sp.]|uniref:phosphatase PAP2 family protein n=1 Tax=uncultured Subdoligranulum sp. TaxID=512298 RepID=UPI00262260D6|nr:phosphatase PAP2 family protein [uncultured Subdoligranulum sp.]